MTSADQDGCWRASQQRLCILHAYTDWARGPSSTSSFFFVVDFFTIASMRASWSISLRTLAEGLTLDREWRGQWALTSHP